MATLTEYANWTPSITMLESQHKVQGGVPEYTASGTIFAGAANVQPGQLANRTLYLKDAVETVETSVVAVEDALGVVEQDLAAHTHQGGSDIHPSATTSLSGFMSATDKTKLDGIADGAGVNVPTNLAQGTRTATTVPVTSSTGSSASLTAATTTLAGVMSATDKVKLDGIAAGAQVNVATNLTWTPLSTGGTLSSSTGTAATFTLVSTTLAGLMSPADKTKLDSLAAGGVAKTGDTMTGQLIGTQTRMAGYIDKVLIQGAATGTTNLACATYSIFNLTLGGSTTLAISTMPTFTANSEALTIVVKITQGATAQSLSWFAGITWLTTGGTAPSTPAANKTVEYVFTNIDSTGAAWVGRVGASN